MSKKLVIMFVKEPKLGFVKTRLAKTCGDEFTLELYKCFVKDLINTLEHNNYDFKLCAYPNLEKIDKEFGSYNNFLQVEGSLGLKMKEAFSSQFDKEYEKIVLIGSDTPHISNKMIEEAFFHLDSNDIILGPSLDGGYYLIAFNNKTFYENVFEEISWSTSLVLGQTLQKLNEKKVHFLMKLNDIDVIEDLKNFYNEYKKSDFKSSKTIMFLKENQLWKSLT